MAIDAKPNGDMLRMRVEELRANGIPLYPSGFSRTHSLLDVNELYEEVQEYGEAVDDLRLCGRVTRVHNRDGAILLTVEDRDARLQFYLYVGETRSGDASTHMSVISTGDYLGFTVDCLFRTRAGLLTARVKDWSFLALCLVPIEAHVSPLRRAYRPDVLQLVTDIETRDRFVLSAKVSKYVRRFLEDHYDFIEVNQQMLAHDGLTTNPHSVVQAADPTAYALRNDDHHWTYLDRFIVGGLERVYEGVHDVSFRGAKTTGPGGQMLACCMAPGDVDSMMQLTEGVISRLSNYLHGTQIIPWMLVEQTLFLVDENQDELPDSKTGASSLFDHDEVLIDLTPPWPRRSIFELAYEATGVDFQTLNSVDEAIAAARAVDVDLESIDEATSIAQIAGTIVDQLVAPGLRQPTFLVMHPHETSRFMKRHDDHSQFAERFELFINGLKFADGGSRITDPSEFNVACTLGGAAPAIGQIRDFGMPPTGQLILNIDRLSMLMTGTAE